MTAYGKPAYGKLVRRFYDGDRVRHRKTDRTGTVIGVSRKGKGRYYMLIDWDDRDRNKIVDLWTWWPPASFAPEGVSR